MTYVYPVVSRRAGGVSVGINLNPNNACNWHCIYCQVPNLVRGGPPPLDLPQMEDELRRLLEDIRNGAFMAERVPADLRVLADMALSGNGEPTSAPEFPRAVAIVAKVLDEYGLAGRVKLRLITNGSLLDRAAVREGIALIGKAGGEVWFKLDGGSQAAIWRINGSRQKPAAVLRRLALCAALCETWVQSCFFALDGNSPGERDIADYLDVLEAAKAEIAGVHLYGLARPSCQAEASRLGRLSSEWLEGLAMRIRACGLTVRVSP
ncbi:MAG: radical SAM protein [Rhodocyclaceae bacterium]|nr:radical SAM protein [Rhodocyclaceae bacterium]